MDEETKKQLFKKGDGILCAFAVFVKEGKILLGLRNYTRDKWKDVSVWTIPGGRSSEGEVILDVLKREVFEEVGISDFEILDFLGEFQGSKEGDECLLFLCDTKDEPKLMEPEKFSEWKWFDADSFPENYVNSSQREAIINSMLK